LLADLHAAQRSSVHAGLGISESDWQLTLKHLTATLDKFKVADKERNEILKLFSSLKSDIVEK
jgi:hemoglobin